MKNIFANKKVVIGGIILFLALGAGIFAITKNKTTEPVAETPALKKRKISEPVNIIEVSERPYITIQPNTDGRNLTINIDSLKKPATEAEYELEYKSGSLQQGVFGSVSLTTLPATSKQLMGSCSAGGACSYHENVTGGTLVTRFVGPENYALKTEWRYIENKTKNTQMSSTDVKFQLTSPEIAKVTTAIIGDASGLPAEIEGEIVSSVYFLETIPSVKGSAELTMRANQEGELVIMGWDGTTWKEFSGTIDGKSITAQVELLQAYVVVIK